ncbi:DUF2804 domain-containing protein [Halorientalis brevis]|uniref:DUF2804 domain-containing protein n=1 Tax=Halorientalis brevis TaxID=1126241 RepID=A0ABD6CFT1_9EURY|nr:DUF2804 domain-containing protein [Halorientalis brevis]
MTLPQAPMRPVVDGRADYGTYAGACETTSLASLPVNRLRKLVQEKGWQWFCAIDDELAVGGAVVDAGLANQAFVWVLDRERNRLILDESRLLPPTTVQRADRPSERPRVGASFRDVTLAATEKDAGFMVAGQFGPVTLDLTLTHDAAGPVTAICPVDDGRHPGVNVTQKSTCLSATGAIDWHGCTHTFDGADGMLDFTHGVLARDTRWRWAIGTGRTDDGTPIGFNLVDGFNSGLENAVWIGDDRRAVEAAAFSYDRRQPGASWAVETDDGAVDVELEPEAVRSEDLNLGLVVSRYAQPLGRWRGTVAGREVELVGVAESHHAKW